MRIGPQRPINPEAIAVPEGYRVEALVTGLAFPSAISFGPGGELYLSEAGGVAGNVITAPRVLRIDPDQSVNEIGRLDNPIVGLAYRNGELLIAEDGDSPRILRVTAEGELKILVDGLPGGGDYGLSGLSLDRSGAVLFGLGVRTNSGVVGLDNVARGWPVRNPEWADTVGGDVELAGVNYVTSQPTSRGQAGAVTGGFKPYGRRSEPGETVKGSALSGGAIYRMAAESGEPERLATGLRNPIGIAVGPDGRFWATEGGMEERGSRPIAGAPDSLWEIQPGGFYGWPDFAAGVSVTESRFRLPGHPQPSRLLARTPRVFGTPAALFDPRSGIGRVDFSFAEEFGYAGEAFVALSGPWSHPAYVTDEALPGHRVVRVDTRTGEWRDFLSNKQRGPSSASNSGGLERPFEVRFDPSGEVLYVVDLGEVQISRENGLEPYGGAGVVWRITRIGRTISAPRRERPEAVETGEETEGDLLEDETLEGAPEDVTADDESPADPHSNVMAEEPATDVDTTSGEEQLSAAAEIAAAGEGLSLEPTTSDWLPQETASPDVAGEEPGAAIEAVEAESAEAEAKPAADSALEDVTMEDDASDEAAAPEAAGAMPSGEDTAAEAEPDTTSAEAETEGAGESVVAASDERAD